MSLSTAPEVTKIRINRLGHMVYGHPDLAKIKTFLLDFGMTVVEETDEIIYLHGYGPQPYVYIAKKTEERSYQGAAFVVEERADLERAAKLGGKEIVPLEGPGGGFETVLSDPDDHPVRFVWGQTMAALGEYPKAIVSNFEATKERKGEFLRFEVKPAMIHKLGHFGVTISNFQQTWDWYTTNFNLVASDIMYDEEDVNVGAFLHIDLGETFTDHHTFFFMMAPSQHVHHSSFEVHDFDTQMLGHKYLEEKGYKLEWGIGRHVLGSQIFDYWRDPVGGFMIEHYCDGDVVNKHNPTKRSAASEEGLAVWGPQLPESFLT